VAAHQTRVIKLGGSLLDWPQLLERLRAWRRRQPTAHDVLLIGGGALAEALRRFDHIHKLGEPAAHWLCIDAMAIHARAMDTLLEEARLVGRLEECRHVSKLDGPKPPLMIVDPVPLLKLDEPSAAGTPLTHGWHVTSDSIAARLSEMLAAEELTLLKSTLPTPGATRRRASAAGYTDQDFARSSRSLTRVRCVNLRADDFAEVWLPSD
jgi:aspartokinase-like uncharacterized kinase